MVIINLPPDWKNYILKQHSANLNWVFSKHLTMKTKFKLILLAVFYFCSLSYAGKSVAVMNIQSAEVDPANCIAITNYMTSELNRISDYRVISWDDVNKILEHKAGLQLLGCEDNECFVEVGGVLGVDYIIVGDIGALGDRYVMSIRKIDINKAETVARASRRVIGNIGLLMDKIPEMVNEIFNIEEPKTKTVSVEKKKVWPWIAGGVLAAASIPVIFILKNSDPEPESSEIIINW